VTNLKLSFRAGAQKIGIILPFFLLCPPEVERKEIFMSGNEQFPCQTRREKRGVQADPEPKGRGPQRFKSSRAEKLSHCKAACLWLAVILLQASNVFAEPSVSKSEENKTLLQKLGIFDIFKQPPPQEKVQSLEPVTVISSRLPSAKENINDRPSNVTYKSKDDLELTHSLTFQEAVRDTEGAVFYDEVGNGVDTTFSLRGFSNSSAVVFLVDGVRVNEVDSGSVNFPLIPMRDVQSVQIERGSTSSVYGSNAFGGVVNVTTGQPSPKPLSLFGGLEWTSFHGLLFHQGVSGTLQDKITPLGGKFSYYFSGERDDTSSFRNHDDWRLTSFDFKAAYELPEQQGKVYVGVKHIEDAVNTPGEITLQQFQDGDLTRSNKPLDGRKFKNTVVQVGADKSFWDDRLTASAMASWRMNRRHIYTTYGTFLSWPYNFDPNSRFINSNAVDKDLTWQLKYNDQWGDVGNEALLGMEYRRSGFDSAERYGVNGHIQEDLAATSDRNAAYDNVGLFWRETPKFFNERVIPYFGMRHDVHWLNTNDMLTPTNNVSNRWDQSTVSTGLTVKPFAWNDIFGNYSQGFRVPTMDETIPYAGTNQSNLLPEKSESYEVGTRVRYRDLAAVKFSYFLIDVNDEIAWDNARSQYYNIAQTRRYGTEQRIDLKPARELSLYGSYTLTEAYVHNDGSSGLVKGRSLGQVPESRFTLGGTLTPLKRFGTPYDGLRLGLNGVFTGKQHPASYQNASEAVLNATGGAGHWIKDYSVWNFMTSYVWRDQEIYFKINNLFAEKYYSRAYSGTSWGTSTYPAGTYTWVDPGAPREFVLGMRWEIG
jgi:outer membrane cobalamin receptor